MIDDPNPTMPESRVAPQSEIEPRAPALPDVGLAPVAEENSSALVQAPAQDLTLPGQPASVPEPVSEASAISGDSGVETVPEQPLAEQPAEEPPAEARATAGSACADQPEEAPQPVGSMDAPSGILGSAEPFPGAEATRSASEIPQTEPQPGQEAEAGAEQETEVRAEQEAEQQADLRADQEEETPAIEESAFGTAEGETPGAVGEGEVAEQAGPEEPTAAQPLPPPSQEASKPAQAPKSSKMDWYILKVQSNREESIREGLRRRIAIAGLDSYFGDIIIPTEKVTEFKAGKRKVTKRKLYPGYLVVQMEINEDTWFLVRETPGIGDFTGAGGHPTPMQPREVAAILAKQEEKPDEAPKLKIGFSVGDHVKIKEGTFENFEGDVANIDETNGRVTVLINIFGRSTPVDIEYWQIERV